jgi:hypothetical protein
MTRTNAHETQKILFKAGYPTRLVPYKWLTEERRYEYFLDDCSWQECRENMVHQSVEIYKAQAREKHTSRKGLMVIEGGKR